MKCLHNDSWNRRGCSLLWDGSALSTLIRPSEVISIRKFFIMAENWPEDFDGSALVVAGLEGCLDILSSEDAISWLEKDFQPGILRFQEAYDSEIALIFWIPTGRKKIHMNPATEEYHWTSGKNDQLPIGRCLWKGAQADVHRILLPHQPEPDPNGKDWAGLYHPRIS